MFLKERQNRIVELVNASGRVAVSDLARDFGVTEDCIRKDLKELDRQGLLERVYGGAMSVQALPDRKVLKRTESPEAKQAIAERAFELVRDGSTIYLDVSTTTLALARVLAAGSKRCTVVSNMLEILDALAPSPQVAAIGTGGIVNADLGAFVGATAIAALDSYSFDAAFMGALGIDAETGSVTTFEAEDGLVKRHVIGLSRHNYLLADTNKLSRRGPYRYATLDDFDALVSEKDD